MISCTVKLEFCSAKRLVEYGGKCRYLHGYGHKVEVTFIPAGCNDNDTMVEDFYALKARLGEWLDREWDHNVLLNEKDKPLGQAIADLTGQTPFYLPTDPTAENLATYLKEVVCPELFTSVRCRSVRLYDSDSAWVEVQE